jgi:hypothetical protein
MTLLPNKEKALSAAVFMLTIGAILAAIGAAQVFGLGYAFIVIGIVFLMTGAVIVHRVT